MVERRLATRHVYELDVDVHSKTDRARVRATDVSRHGLFVQLDQPSPLHHALLLTVHLRGGPFETMATVVRRSLDASQGAVGMGLKLFCLGAQAKSRWDLFVASLDDHALTLPVRNVRADGGACFLVQPETVAELYEFFAQNVAVARTLYLSPAIRKIGAPVQVVLVHPESNDELTLFAKVVEWSSDHPLRMGIRFDALERDAKTAFKKFLGPVPGLGGALRSGEGTPLVSHARPRWTEYAYYSPKIRATAGSFPSGGEAPPSRPHGQSDPSGEVVLLEDEVSASQPPSPAELDVIEGQLLDLPEMRMVDRRALFDFAWSNSDDDEEDTKPG